MLHDGDFHLLPPGGPLQSMYLVRPLRDLALPIKDAWCQGRSARHASSEDSLGAARRLGLGRLIAGQDGKRFLKTAARCTLAALLVFAARQWGPPSSIALLASSFFSLPITVLSLGTWGMGRAINSLAHSVLQLQAANFLASAALIPASFAVLEFYDFIEWGLLEYGLQQFADPLGRRCGELLYDLAYKAGG